MVAMATQQQRREKGKRVCSRCRQCSHRAATAAGLTAATSTTTTMTSASPPALPAKRRRSHGRCETLKTRLGGGTREAGGLGEGRRRGAAAAGEGEGEQRPNNSCRARNIQMELLDEQLTSLLELCKPREGISTDDSHCHGRGKGGHYSDKASTNLAECSDLPVDSNNIKHSLHQPQLSSKPKAPSGRPRSFLRDEIDEFDRIFAALSSLTLSSPVELSELDSSESLATAAAFSEDEDDKMRRLFGNRTTSSKPPISPVRPASASAASAGGKARMTSVVTSKPPLDVRRSPTNNLFRNGGNGHEATVVDSLVTTTTASPLQTTAGTQRLELQEHHFSDDTPSSTATGGMQSPLSPVRPWLQNDRLFEQLLDDLDNIGDTNNASARKRRKARAIFSEWVFSPDARGLDPDSPVAAGGGDSRRPSSASSGCSNRMRQKQRGEDELAKKNRRQSAYVPSTVQHRPRDLRSERRPRSACDLTFAPPPIQQQQQDDADSGYHTAENTLVAGSRSKRRTAGQWTLAREDLVRRIEAFNHNSHGLVMTIDEVSNTFQGFIRVHMNLIRPINMSLSARPPSIYEVLSHEAPPTANNHDTQLASFHLPKGTTKVIHILSDTTVHEVIRCLLSKFRITDSPRKFVLYVNTMSADGKSVMRRLQDDELPLVLCLSWTARGLNQHKFILQENDVGDIQWESFSLPELERFLTVLNREEAEYIEQVKVKYELLRQHLDSCLSITE